MKKVVYTEKAPKVVGPYSQAIVTNNHVFCSGQIGINPEVGSLIGPNIEEQTEQVIKNLSEVLKEAGTSLDNVVQTQCFLSDMKNYQKFNEAYNKYFENSKPARFTVGVKELPMGALVEIAAIAIV